MKNVSCVHCGKTFDNISIENTYSIAVDEKGSVKEILIGEIVPEALHYCSSDCMFNRSDARLMNF